MGQRFRHINAHQFLVIASEHTSVGKGRVRPAHTTALIQLICGGLNDPGATDFVIPLRCQAADDEVSAFSEEPESVPLTHHVYIGPSSFGYGLLTFPDSIAIFYGQAPQLAVAVHAVDKVTFNDGC